MGSGWFLLCQHAGRSGPPRAGRGVVARQGPPPPVRGAGRARGARAAARRPRLPRWASCRAWSSWTEGREIPVPAGMTLRASGSARAKTRPPPSTHRTRWMARRRAWRTTGPAAASTGPGPCARCFLLVQNGSCRMSATRTRPPRREREADAQRSNGWGLYSMTLSKVER